MAAPHAEGQAERLDAQTGINGYYRRVLTDRESRMWWHCNPDMAMWRRKIIIEETARAAEADGFGGFAVFDVDEALLAQGAGNSGGRIGVFNKTGEQVISLTVDAYGNGKVGAWNREGTGRTLTPQ